MLKLFSINRKNKIIFAIGLNAVIISIIMIVGHLESSSDTYSIAKYSINQNQFVKRETGGTLSIEDYPSTIFRNDSIYYFTKVKGAKNDLYVMCTLYLNNLRQWEVVSVTENKGQFYRLKSYENKTQSKGSQ